jgi:hypothetical protein
VPSVPDYFLMQLVEQSPDARSRESGCVIASESGEAIQSRARKDECAQWLASMTAPIRLACDPGFPRAGDEPQSRSNRLEKPAAKCD